MLSIVVFLDMIIENLILITGADGDDGDDYTQERFASKSTLQ